MSLETTTATASSQALSDEDIQNRAVIDRSTKGAVTFFVVSGVFWLVMSSFFGLLTSIKQHNPTFLNCDWLQWLNWGRLQPAFTTALVYGWAFQAAFAVAIFIMARVCRSPLKNGPTLIVAGHLWNIAVTLAVGQILCGAQHPAELLEFGTGPALLMLGAFVAITVWLVLMFASRPKDADYISQWYILGAIIWFPLLFVTANVFTRGGVSSGIHAAAIGNWYGSTVIQWFLIPMALAAAYYVIPKITGRSIHSYTLAQGGFWGLAFFGGFTGLQRLIGGPVPQWWSGLSVLAQWLLLVPVVFVAANHFMTVRGRHGLVESSPTLRFTFGGAVFFVMGHIAAAFVSAFPGLFAFTLAQDAVQTALVYGASTLMLFGAIYFIMPRLTGCEWLSSGWINFHFWMNIYGMGAIFIILLAGGMAQGQAVGTWNDSPDSLFYNARGFLIGRSVGWFFIAFANLLYFFHVILMALRLGRRSERPTLLSHHSHDEASWDKSEVIITTEGAEAR